MKVALSVGGCLFLIATGLMNLHHGGKEQLAECLVDKHSSFSNGELVVIATRQQLKECMK
jgi:hypothetical protein